MKKRQRMKKAGALCPVCKSHKIACSGRSCYSWDRRHIFRCLNCGNDWTAGTNGRPYSDFVKVKDHFNWEQVYGLTERNDADDQEWLLGLLHDARSNGWKKAWDQIVMRVDPHDEPAAPVTKGGVRAPFFWNRTRTAISSAY